MDYRQLMEKKRYISMIFIKMMNAGSSVVQGKKETFSLAVSKLQCCFLTENSICKLSFLSTLVDHTINCMIVVMQEHVIL